METIQATSPLVLNKKNIKSTKNTLKNKKTISKTEKTKIWDIFEEDKKNISLQEAPTENNIECLYKSPNISTRETGLCDL